MGRLVGATALVPSPGHELGDERQAAGDARTPSLDADRGFGCWSEGQTDALVAGRSMSPEPSRPSADGPARAATPAPAAFHLGAGHLIVHANPAFVAAFGREAIGQPAREALIGLPPKAFELMDLVFRTGKPGACRVTTTLGPRRLVVAPRQDPETDETYGVTTHLRRIEP